MSDQTAIGRAAQAREGTPFLCCAQAAFYLGMSETTLKQHRKAGTGPRVRRHSRHLRYHIDDLDAWSQQSGETRK
ncbi:MAG: DNA-binding protein [Sphingomonadales bacterium]|nr:MAG: DNA-binding protein [Sphingomonadales bacterium]